MEKRESRAKTEKHEKIEMEMEMEGGREGNPCARLAPQPSLPLHRPWYLFPFWQFFQGKPHTKNVASSSSVCNPRPDHRSAKPSVPSYASMYCRPERWTERRERIE